jgi:hypothetical protein
VTEYVYVDAPADPPMITYVTREAPGAPAPAATVAAAQPTVKPVATPTTPVDEVPTEVPPTNAVPSPTAPPAPPAPAPTATRPPGSGVLGEDEFTGTATAVSGETVTFLHGAVSTVVRVPASVGSVGVGETVKVHAILLSSGWLAKEIETGG